jgi:putative transcriptional regulator
MTGAHLDAEIFDLALGNVADDARERMESHIAECGRCARELADATETLGMYSAAMPRISPPSAVRDRLMSTVSRGGRFDRLIEHVARLIDVGTDKAKALLDGIDDAASWVAGPAPGVMLFHLEGGPAVAGAGIGFVRVAAGQPFPHHKHLGPEVTYVVQGGFREHDGTVQRVGDEDLDEAGTEHSFVALPGPDLIYLTVLRVGVNMGGIEILVGDPRL